MFIAEAPGRLGADVSAIPLHGDKTGNNFEALLQFAGIDRSDIFVTNAVLCNPKDSDGNNSTPNKLEVDNCSKFLKEQIDIINPKVIVTLGAVALSSLSLIESHQFSLKRDIRTSNNWYNRILIPLYHPGQRAMLHRSLANQRSDYQFLKEVFNRLNVKRKVIGSTSKIKNENISSIVHYMLKDRILSYFAIHKLFYLVEYLCVIKYGFRLTSSYIIRQKDGPYCTDLQINKLKNTIPELNIFNSGKNSLSLSINAPTLFANYDSINELPKEVTELIDEVLAKYGNKSNVALKRSVYFTRPMRNILHLESNLGVNFYNSPINFDLQAPLVNS
jgi:uracil-DNA glycosylase family 4